MVFRVIYLGALGRPTSSFVLRQDRADEAHGMASSLGNMPTTSVLRFDPPLTALEAGSSSAALARCRAESPCRPRTSCSVLVHEAGAAWAPWAGGESADAPHLAEWAPPRASLRCAKSGERAKAEDDAAGRCGPNGRAGAHEVDAAAAARWRSAPLETAALMPSWAVRDHELHAPQAAPGELAQEGRPEGSRPRRARRPCPAPRAGRRC